MQESLEKAVQHWNMIAPVIETPKSLPDYEMLLTNLKDALELVENRPDSPLAGLIKAMASAVKEYEDTVLTEKESDPLDALRYLMKLHGIKQSELKEVGSQGVVSEILNGKRSLTLRHVKQLAKKFSVSHNVFFND